MGMFGKLLMGLEIKFENFCQRLDAQVRFFCSVGEGNT